MNVTFICPQCERTTRCELSLEPATLTCTGCQHSQQVTATALNRSDAAEELNRCLICGNGELFVRKNFSQRLGLLIIIVGFSASILTWFYYRIYLTFSILFGTALLDLLLYSIVGNLLQCYRCHSEFRGLSTENYQHFDLEVHERHRQQAARLAELPASPNEISGSSKGT